METSTIRKLGALFVLAGGLFMGWKLLGLIMTFQAMVR